MPSFWYLIQRSLGDHTSNNDRIRKCALYLLKQILTNDEYKYIEIKDEKFDRLLILINDQSKQFWIDFIVLYEALEDGVVHLIKPLLTKFDRLLHFSLEQSIFRIFMKIKFLRFFCRIIFNMVIHSTRTFIRKFKFTTCTLDYSMVFQFNEIT
jgi:hypothetical protein